MADRVDLARFMATRHRAHRLLTDEGRVPRPGSRRRVLQGLISGIAAASAPALLRAQSYPSRPIRMIVPFTPGGSTDILGRSVGQALAESLGQAVVIDNVPGAGGSIGADRVAKAAPDGYTLLMGHIGTLAVTPSIYPKLPYDPERSFAAVAWVARVPNVLVVHPSLPAGSVVQLIDHVRARPGLLNYGSGGNGSAAHLATEALKLAAGIDLVHVPYRGTQPALADLVSGQIQLMFTGAPAVQPFLRNGRLKALAVSSATRLESLPDLPPLADAPVQGLAGFEADQWYGVVAPAGTPAPIISQLNAAINASLSSGAMASRLSSEGAIPQPAKPEVFQRLIADEIRRWRPVVQRAKIAPD